VAVLDRRAAADQQRARRTAGSYGLVVHVVVGAGVVGEEDAVLDVRLAELERERGAAKTDGEDRESERQFRHPDSLHAS
jgi:hypothetical protein